MATIKKTKKDNHKSECKISKRQKSATKPGESHKQGTAAKSKQDTAKVKATNKTQQKVNIKRRTQNKKPKVNIKNN